MVLKPSSSIQSPFLRTVRLKDGYDAGSFPFTLPLFSSGFSLDLAQPVTILVGENGSGKSTLLEGIATACGFNIAGGNRNHRYEDKGAPESGLGNALALSWSLKVTDGFFMRAESFFNFASYIDDVAKQDRGVLRAYGNKSLHQQSHGESFLSLFANKLDKGLFILDEPEAALSPQRQLSFLSLIHDLEVSGKSQFIIATHSPILLTYPQANLLSLDGGTLHPVRYQDTEHFTLTRRFLESPERYYRHLFGAEDENLD